MTEPTIYAALAAVMADVKAVGKDGWNDHQKFKFRGIDGVVNAVGPALRAHGVIVVPEVMSVQYDDVQTTTGKQNTACRVQVAYTFHGPAGDNVRTVVAGEAWDAGDKATPKAMSVAFRTALLQALALPTDDPDPDESSYERVDLSSPTEPSPEVAPLLDEAMALAAATGIAPRQVLERFATKHDGLHITRATAEQLQPVLDELRARKDQADTAATDSAGGQE